MDLAYKTYPYAGRDSSSKLDSASEKTILSGDDVSNGGLSSSCCFVGVELL